MNQLAKKIAAKRAVVGVIGLGYVGLPLAAEFARAGFKVYGLDVDAEKVARLRRGHSYVQDVESKDLAPLVRRGRFFPTSNPACLARCDAIVICVPTPLNKLKEPDISHVLDAARTIRKHLRRGQLVILESTTYPGTTDEAILPEISRPGLRVGRDFYLCFSPERIDPGNRDFPLQRIPKVVGGLTPGCARLAKLLYSEIIEHVIEVSSTRVAEFTKLLENTFRIVNIGLVNELVQVSQKLGVNIWEAIDAAKTKPFGYMPFYPGPGIGGHCIGIDPLYLSWKAKLAGSEIRFVELASRVNETMPGYVVQRAAYAMNLRGKTISRARILVLGVSYKKDVDDVRESPAISIIEELRLLGARVHYHDPLVKRLAIGDRKLASVPLTRETLRSHDLAILVTHHSPLDYGLIAKAAPLILDTRNAFREFPNSRGKIILL
jgi:UDP-N-acetyl-D-glucosamine dehydrogenase